MSDSKVFMFPESGYDRGTDAALLATLANNRGNDMAAMAMMNGGGMGMNGMWNNPIWAIVFLAALQNGGLFGGNGRGQAAQGIELQNQISAIRETLSTNQNSGLLMDAIKGNSTAIGQLAGQLNCDFNTLNNAICDVRGSVDKVAASVGFSSERVINAINSGDASLANQLAQCCCTIREAVTTQGFENQIATLNQTNVLQNAINTVATGQERGFSAVAYETQKQTCDIQNSLRDATAQILEGQRAAEMRELQNKVDALRELNSQKDVVINNGQQTALFSQMIQSATTPIAQAVSALQGDVNGIKCKLPETVSIPYPQLTAIPSCAASALAGYGLFGGFGTWNNGNTLWG